MSRDDWRRQNVNVFIERVYKRIKSEKPWVKFGISPFGIWRPGNPPQIKGFDPYDQLYADARKWLQNGWCDYFAPQLYWAIDPPEQSFPALLKWWCDQNVQGRHVIPGMNSASVPGAWEPAEIERQISIARKQPGAGGHIHWNMSSLMRSATFRDTLTRSVYSAPAIPPPSRWLSAAIPAPPALRIGGRSQQELQWRNWGTNHIGFWLVQTSYDSKWTSQVVSGATRSLKLRSMPDVVAVSAINRFGSLSKPAVLQRKR